MAKQSVRATTVAPDNLLKMYPHCLFRPPEQAARRRGPLPRGVVSIKHASRLRVGALAEVVNASIEENNGLRVVITDFDSSSNHCWVCKSLDRDIRWTEGGAGQTASLRSRNLRRVWVGLSANERTRLRMRRAS
jgi:hypothetical protein